MSLQRYLLAIGVEIMEIGACVIEVNRISL